MYRFILDSKLAINTLFIILLIISYFVWSFTKNYYDLRNKNYFKSNVNKITDNIEKRMLVYENALRSGIAFYQASEHVSREEWHIFVKNLQIKNFYPGIQGLGIALMLKENEIKPLESLMQKEGYTSFELKPKGKRDQYSTIIYLEPLDARNREAIGYDMFSQSTRREAMEAARDTGYPTISGRVTLVQEIDSDVQAGVLMYLPLYKKSLPTNSVEERRKALLGYVYSPFRMRDLMQPSLDKEPSLYLELYDGEKSDKNLLFKSSKEFSNIGKQSVLDVLHIGGRAWNVYVYSTQNLDKQMENYIPKILTSLWTIFSLIVYLVLIILYNGRKNLTRQVYQRTKELEESKQIAEEAVVSKSLFLANMSHEIRTPMNAILGFVEQLSKNEKEPDRQKMFDTITHSGHALLTIINDILDITKIESGKMLLDAQNCQLHRLFEEVSSLFTVSLKSKNIEYKLAIDDNIPECSVVDEVRVKQCLINIIANAIKFTDESGKIECNVHFNNDGQEICIDIKDNGIGIAKENIEKIFNIFEQEDASKTRRFGGTGLGLSITKKLIEIMDGNIKVESSLGKGSLFKISLPYIACKDQKNLSINDKQLNDMKLSDGVVLIVEDNKTNQLLLCIILDELGVDYKIANNGQEAVDMFGNDSFSIILMDENMPIMNGIEAVKKIREIEIKGSLLPTPIIAVTANAINGDKKRFIEAGMNDYIAKPYSETDIKKVLFRYMSY
ncbi:CHASE domain-containing protein [Sulfurimonas sp.]|uniref:CHASE domain-containing protein n=1 Tax=Sulfurimonas sp. TaxID=2022749 RepID=UPI003569ABB7